MRCSWTFSTQKSKQSTSKRASSAARMALWMFSISYSRVRREERSQCVVYLPCPQWRHRTYLCCPASLQTRGRHHAVSGHTLPSSSREICRLQRFPTRTESLGWEGGRDGGTRPVWDSLQSSTSCKTGDTKWQQLSSWRVSYGNGLRRKAA